jgi:hypothetical protein
MYVEHQGLKGMVAWKYNSLMKLFLEVKEEEWRKD